MSKVTSSEFRRHAIVGIESPNGNRTAQEMIVHRTAEGEIVVTPVPNTERTLPLTREEAEKWVSSLPGDMPEEVKQNKIEMLCCEDNKHSP